MPEQQPIVRMARIVDAVLVDDQRADQAAELEQRVPVATVARQPRCLDETTAPTRPSQIAASNFSKPGRAMPEPERPRSSSITSTVLQPSARARSASPYCRGGMSRLMLNLARRALPELETMRPSTAPQG